MWTTDFDRFVAPARARPALWRVLLGFLIVAVGFALGFAAMLVALIAAFGPDGANAYLGTLATGGGTPTMVVLMLAVFIGPLLAVMAVARLLHGRPAATLFGPNLGRGFMTAVVIAALVYAAVTLLLPMPFRPVPNTPLSLFLSFLPLALVGIAIQTGAEEVVFRGYLQQQLAARFRHPIVWMGLPAIAFGLLHGDPSGGTEDLWLMLPPTLFGLIAADLTRVTGSIGAAWGLHFLNNCSAILLLSVDGNLSGLSLYRTPFGIEALSLADPLIWQEMLTTIIVWVCIRLWLARRSTGTGAVEDA
ncbi:CPBP family intramembrane metalloprotease [Jannaschia sp. S6380]|uniref:CPBP family intramembrane glutamic endopeptidase n=1 Tax=Jannaschia sp. S6380 TaxID=2926408 RepID=UPI001FF27718|nr:type II CAAX endopeptidase family protein [Jannaschia sp. S6380]MCK0168666.1 CPBP family intramembrane metalloprotease [Jannaschia sp. S6380]